MSRTTRFPILVVLRLPTFDSNFATLRPIVAENVKHINRSLGCTHARTIRELAVILFQESGGLFDGYSINES